MSLVNESQLLVRNITDLSATAPLFVNFPADSFITEYLSTYPNAKVHCYNTNFEQYSELPQANGGINTAQVEYHFCTHYQTKLTHDVIVIMFPKSKAELGFTLAMLNECADENTRVFIVGNNKSGIKSVEKLTKDYFSFCQKIDSARHCSIYSAALKNNISPFELERWFQAYEFSVAEQVTTVYSLPGVFSQKHLDKGTALLLDNLPANMSESVLDFGCGAGVISTVIGMRYPKIALSLVDVSALALTSSEKTLKANGLTGNLIASNSLSSIEGSYQHIVSNPPFHQGVKTNYAATESFLSGINMHIKKQGTITVVANSFLQYQPIMDKCIGKTERVCNSHGFAIYHCKKS